MSRPSSSSIIVDPPVRYRPRDRLKHAITVAGCETYQNISSLYQGSYGPSTFALRAETMRPTFATPPPDYPPSSSQQQVAASSLSSAGQDAPHQQVAASPTLNQGIASRTPQRASSSLSRNHYQPQRETQQSSSSGMNHKTGPKAHRPPLAVPLAVAKSMRRVKNGMLFDPLGNDTEELQRIAERKEEEIVAKQHSQRSHTALALRTHEGVDNDEDPPTNAAGSDLGEPRSGATRMSTPQLNKQAAALWNKRLTTSRVDHASVARTRQTSAAGVTVPHTDPPMFDADGPYGQDRRSAQPLRSVKDVSFTLEGEAGRHPRAHSPFALRSLMGGPTCLEPPLDPVVNPVLPIGGLPGQVTTQKVPFVAQSLHRDSFPLRPSAAATTTTTTTTTTNSNHRAVSPSSSAATDVAAKRNINKDSSGLDPALRLTATYHRFGTTSTQRADYTSWSPSSTSPNPRGDRAASSAMSTPSSFASSSAPAAGKVFCANMDAEKPTFLLAKTFVEPIRSLSQASYVPFAFGVRRQ